MSLGITNKCFPPANVCVNCERKAHDERPARVGDTSKEYKRCTGCRLMTYCDKDCQLDHWLRIHKHHCRFLSGKQQLDNPRHNPLTCALCIEQRKSTNASEELVSLNSPKIFCYIEEVIDYMTNGIGKSFGFHSEGKTCVCSKEVNWPGQLPFSLGEVTEKYAGEGRGEMISHALKLVMAIVMKDKLGNVKEETEKLFSYIIQGKLNLWVDLLVCGKMLSKPIGDNEALTATMVSLKRSLGANNPWWMSLRFSLSLFNSICLHGSEAMQSDFMKKCENDARFSTFKKVIEYDESQYKNIVFASKNNMMSKFKLWPKIVAKSLALLLPSGLRCQTCNEKVEGQFTLIDDEKPLYPMWLPSIGENGSMKVYCPRLKNPNCLKQGLDRDVRFCLIRGADQWKIYLEELSLFVKLSRMCDECSLRSISTHRCSSCLAVQYCSTVCQGKDLYFHKQVCSNWAKDDSKKLGSSRDQQKYWKSVADNALKKIQKL